MADPYTIATIIMVIIIGSCVVLFLLWQSCLRSNNSSETENQSSETENQFSEIEDEIEKKTNEIEKEVLTKQNDEQQMVNELFSFDDDIKDDNSGKNLTDQNINLLDEISDEYI